MTQRFLKPFIWLILLVPLTACAGIDLGGEPEIVQTIPPIPTASESTAQLPYLERGSAIFAQNCSQCHGTNGAGNGPLVQNGSVGNPGNFTVPAHVDGVTPLDYFSIITNGNLDSLMPPWENALSEADRWAVAMYTYTLHYDEDALTLGAELVDSNIVAPQYAAPEIMAEITDEDIAQLFDTGAIPLLTDWDNLSASEQQGAIAYVRTLSLREEPRALGLEPLTAGAESAAMAAQPEPEATPDPSATGRVSGTVTNRTEGSRLPDDLVVTLHIVDEEFNDLTRDTTINPDGTYLFENVPFVEGNVYFISAEYEGRNYATNIVSAAPTMEEIDLTLTIYDVTDDASVINFNTILIQIQAVGGALQITEFRQFFNNSDRVYITDETALDPTSEERRIAMRFEIPPGARVLGIENEQQYIINEDDFEVLDTRAVIPGVENLFIITYVLPYEQDAIVEYALDYALNGPVQLLLDTDTVSASGTWVRSLGTETINGINYQVYGGEPNISAGDVLRYDLSGRPPAVGTSADDNVVTSDTLLNVVLVIFVVIIVIIIGLVVLARRNQRHTDTNTDKLIDALLKQITALDAQHEAGSINHDVYHQRRQRLQARLEELMDQSA